MSYTKLTNNVQSSLFVIFFYLIWKVAYANIIFYVAFHQAFEILC